MEPLLSQHQGTLRQFWKQGEQACPGRYRLFLPQALNMQATMMRSDAEKDLNAMLKMSSTAPCHSCGSKLTSSWAASAQPDLDHGYDIMTRSVLYGHDGLTILGSLPLYIWVSS